MILKHKPFNKVILIGDTHFGFNSNSLEWLNNGIVFFNEQLIPFIENLVDRERYSVVFMGDLFDKKSSLSTVVSYQVTGLIDTLSRKYGLNVHILVGNHDTPRLEQRELNNCSHLRYMTNVEVYHDPIELATVSGDDVLLMPYMTPKEEKDALMMFNGKYCFCHTDFVGSVYSNGQKIEDDGKALTSSDLSMLIAVWSGHIHKRQLLNMSNTTVEYIGTPYQTRKVENGNDVGFTILDFSEVDSNGLPSSEFIENIVSPFHVKIPLMELLEMDVDYLYRCIRNSYLRIPVTSEELRDFDITKIFGSIPEVYRQLDYELTYNYSIEESVDMDDIGAHEEITNSLKNLDFEDALEEYVNSISVIQITKKEQIDTNPIKKEIFSSLESLYKSHGG